MSISAIEREFCERLSANIRVVAEGKDYYHVFTPFTFNDGDHLAVVLKKEGPNWVLSDEAHTLARLSYDLDTNEESLRQEAWQELITSTLSTFQVEDRAGELIVVIKDACYSDALYSLTQALIRITNIIDNSRPG